LHKRILFLSFSNLLYDGRTRELLRVAEDLGEVIAIVRNGRQVRSDGLAVFCSGNYISFIMLCIKSALKLKTIDILFCDNRMACIPSLLISKLLRPNIIIQDMRELYIREELHSLKGKVGCIFEGALLQKADIIICANMQRAEMTNRIFHPKRMPLVFENIRKLAYMPGFDVADVKKSFEPYLRAGRIRIISTAGCSVSRTTDKLVMAAAEYMDTVDLLLVGSSGKNDRDMITGLLEKRSINNVFIIDQLTEGNLKYLISRCHIGAVIYGQYDSNNKYCASGKIYEFLFEGMPILTSDNPPLKEFCEKEKVGVASDMYSLALKKILQNYNFYRENSIKFFLSHNSEQNRTRLIREIANLLII